MNEDDEPRFGRESVRDSVRRYLETRSPFAGMSRAELEQFVNEYLHGDSKSRERIEDLIEEIRARSRRSVDRLGDLVRSEVRKEFESFSPSRREEIGEFFERLIGLVGEYFGPGRQSRTSEPKGERQAVEAVKKAVKKAAKKVPAKKAAARKVLAKKAAATKASAKRAATKASPRREPSP